jgi:uncharacterized membrane protein
LKTRIANRWHALRATFWFVPALFAAAAAALAVVLVELDERHYADFEFLYQGDADGARGLLAMLAGSMIGTAGVAFSITIVALSLASSQFGPRLLRNFLRDPGNQVALGSFVATFLYCLVVLRSIVDGRPVPVLAVSFAVALSLASLGVLIFFFHHVAASIQASNVVAAVAGDLQQAIERFCPEGAGGEEPAPAAAPRGGVVVAAERSGYVQAIDHQGLVAIAARLDAVIEALPRAGHFAIAGSPLARVAASGAVAEADAAAVRRAFVIGAQRTPDQDLEYSVRQLVEVALRALSPGINDPFTAMNCIDWLGVAVVELGRRGMPRSRHRDGEGRLRLLTAEPTFAGVVDAAFQQIRQAGAGHVAVAIRLLETFAAIAPHLRRAADLEPLRAHADRVRDAALAEGPIEADAAALAARHAAARQACEGRLSAAAGS